jgi:amino acid permease
MDLKMVYVALFILCWLIAVIVYIAVKVYQKYKARLKKPHFFVMASCALFVLLVACGKPLAKEATIENKMYAKECIMTLKNQSTQKLMLEELGRLNKERAVYNLAKKCFDIKYDHKKNKEVVS